MGTIPPVVARMWGRDTSSRHGPRPSLDVAGIVAAAIAIADADGLAGVRMSSVAAALGVAPMSLYRYVGSKDELLVLMADAAVPDPPALAGDWRDYLTVWTRANRDFLIARPWQLELTRRTPPTGPRMLLWLDRALAALDGTGLPAQAGIAIATTLTGYAASQASLAASMVPQEALDGPADYGAILTELLDPATYPALSAAVAGGAFGANPDWIDDADFLLGLDLILRGVESIAREFTAG
jgi:AcrR family transcriptional regulator